MYVPVSMLQDVALGERSLADYTHLVGRGLIEEIRELAEPLAGKRVLHVSATAFGGGVSEILYTMVPLMRDVGLDAHWRVILGREEFFNVTKLMHNSLQGDPQGDHRPAVGGVRGLQRDERAEPRRRLGRDHRPRPSAGGPARQCPRPGPNLDLALSHRPLDAKRGDAGAPPAAASRLRRDGLAPAAVRARRHGRPARGSSRRRSTRCRRRTWRSPPRTPPTSASSSGSTSSAR